MPDRKRYNIDPMPESSYGLRGIFPNQVSIMGALFFNVPFSFYLAFKGFSGSATIDEVRKLDKKGNCWEVRGEAEFGHDVPWRRYRAQFRIKQKYGWFEYLE